MQRCFSPGAHFSKGQNTFWARIQTSLRKQPTFGDATTGFLPNDVWETSTEIPYWWHITTQIWVVLLIGWIKFPTQHDQSEALLHSTGLDSSLKKQLTFGDAATRFPTKWCLRNEHRNFILMTCQDPVTRHPWWCLWSAKAWILVFTF